jgi:predicted transposase YbfD/YdcC
MLNLKGVVVTIDAMRTQRAIASQIVEKGGDCILSVKGICAAELLAATGRPT